MIRDRYVIGTLLGAGFSLAHLIDRLAPRVQRRWRMFVANRSARPVRVEKPTRQQLRKLQRDWVKGRDAEVMANPDAVHPPRAIRRAAQRGLVKQMRALGRQQQQAAQQQNEQTT